MYIKNVVMRKSVFIIGLILLISGFEIEAQTVQSVFNTRYAELATVLKTDGSVTVNDENVNLYRNQYQKLKEGYKEIEMFEFKGATPERKLDSLKSYVKESQKGVKCLLKDKSRYGADSVECREQYSNLTSLIKAKDYDHAYTAWKTLFIYYPKSFKGLYNKGDYLMRLKINQAEKAAIKANNEQRPEDFKILIAEREAWIDTLLLVYDQRITYFGNDKLYGESYLTGKKGIYIYKYRRQDLFKKLRENQLDSAYQYLKYSIEKGKLKTNADIAKHYYLASHEMYLAKKLDAAQVVGDYNLAIGVLEGNIAKYEALITKYPESKKTKSRQKAVDAYKKVASNLTDKFSKGDYSTCENLVPAFEKGYEAKKADKDWLIKVTNMLGQRGCTDSKLYENATVELYGIDPSPTSAYKLGQLYLKKKDYVNAAKYYEEAYTNEPDTTLKAQYYFEAAIIAEARGQDSKARSLALTSNKLKTNGKAYILIARLYAGTSNCGADAFEKRWVYWLAVDKLNYAKSIDASVAAEANKQISKYRSYYPPKSEGFMRSIHEGNSVTVGCWIQESTTAKYIK